MSKTITLNGNQYQVPNDSMTISPNGSTTISSTSPTGPWHLGPPSTHTINGNLNVNGTITVNQGNYHGTTNHIIIGTEGQAEVLKDLVKSGQLTIEDLEVYLEDLRKKNRLAAIHNAISMKVPNAYYKPVTEESLTKAIADYEIEKLIEE